MEFHQSALALEEVLEQLRSLPGPTDPRFEFALTEWVQKRRPQEDGDRTRDALSRILEDGEQAAEVRFKAFYALHIRYRRLKEHSDLRDLMTTHGPDFENEPLYPHLRSLVVKQRYADLRQALELAEDARLRASEHPGVLHNYAETVAQVEESKESPATAAVQTALDVINTGIALARRVRGGERRDYAKYHATKGRLLALLGRFPEAVEALEVAVDQEDPRQEDYSVRLAEYQAIRDRVLFRQYLSNVRRSLRDAEARAEEDVRQLKGNMIELMGLLAAVIAFLVGGTQAVKQEASAVGLMSALAGAILVTYAGFSAVFHDRPGWGRIAIVLILGLVLLSVVAVSQKALFGLSAPAPWPTR